jgi:diguanylate cyclase (GGDEF)-like protein
MNNSNNKKIVKIIPNLLNKIFNRKLIVPVPFEMKGQFDKLQLKNSIRRIRILTAFIFILKLPGIILYINIYKYFPNMDLIITGQFAELAGIVVFNAAVWFFSKRDKKTMLWVICYLYTIYSFTIYSISMVCAGTHIHILLMFFVSLFLTVLLADFKPKIFIPLSILYYAAAVYILLLHGDNRKLNINLDYQIFIFVIFFITLCTKVIFYNNHVRLFKETFELAEANDNLACANEKLKSLSITDELTRLNNRRSFLDYMNIIWKQSYRLRLPVNVLMIDIDYFKKYNDSLGHLEGDRALIAVAQCLKDQLKREIDFVARYGGEEFVCLLPYDTKENTENFAKKLVRAVEDLNIIHPMSEHSKYVTISVGVASVLPGEQDSPAQLLAEADKAL